MTEQLTLAGLEAPTVCPRSRRHQEMIRLYGLCEGRHCRSCAHLILVQPGQNRYFKCDLTVITRGPGSDWRAGWEACGKWEERVR